MFSFKSVGSFVSVYDQDLCKGSDYSMSVGAKERSQVWGDVKFGVLLPAQLRSFPSSIETILNLLASLMHLGHIFGASFIREARGGDMAVVIYTAKRLSDRER